MIKRILFQGDSITDGNRYKDPEQAWDLNHQMGHSYAFAINAYLGNRYPERGFQFMNRGISGNKVRDIRARMAVDIVGLKPDLLSVLVGVNDGPFDFNGFVGTEPAAFKDCYAGLLREAIAALPGLKLVLCEPFELLEGSTRKNAAEASRYIVGYQKAVAELASEFGASFVPLQARFSEKSRATGPQYWIWDGIHPTENGHGLIAEEWLKVVAPLVVGQSA